MKFQAPIGTVFVFNMSVDLGGSGVNLVQHIQCGNDMENLRIMLEYLKHLQNMTTMACYV